MPKVAVNQPKTPVTKGSSGVAAATVPNICKMPPPPPPFAPTPLPNVGQSGKTPKGYTTNVKVEGQPVAITGASFGSSGDIASKATGGGIVSNNAEGQTKFIAPGAIDTRMQNKFVQLLGDQMMNNCGMAGAPPNAATPDGEKQGPNVVPPAIEDRVACECQREEQPDRSLPKEKQCEELIDRRGKCVTKKLSGKESEGIFPNARFPPPPDSGKSRIVPDLVITAPGSYPSAMTSVGKLKRAKKAGLTPGPVEKVVDFKFPCPPSTKAPFPPASADGKGYGVETGAGRKEIDEYSQLTDPPSKPKVVTPTEQLCG